MKIDSIGHLVLTVRNIEITCDFYTRVLGMKVVSFGGDRKALVFGSLKLNLHQHGSALEPKAMHPTPGSADLCFITSIPLPEVARHLFASGVIVLEGPVRRNGATGPIISLYFRDPDLNLIEVSNYID